MTYTPKQLSRLSNSDLKALGNKDYSKISDNGLKILSSSETKESPSDSESFIGNLIENIPGATKVGISDLANNITQDVVHYSPLRLIPAIRNLASNSQSAFDQVQRNNPKIGTGIGSDIGYYGPQIGAYASTAVIPGLDVDEAAASLSKLGLNSKLAKALAILTKSGENAGIGAALNYKDPTLGALISGGAYPAGLAIGKISSLAGKGTSTFYKKVSRLLGNKKQIFEQVLNDLNKQSEKGASLTPEETAKNLSENFSDDKGKTIPVDIGTLTNEQNLKSLYQNLPWADVSSKQASNKNMALDNQIAKLQNQIKENEIIKDVHSTAPALLNSLLKGSKDKANLDKELSNQINTQFKIQKAKGNKLYAPLNNQNIRFDTLPSKDVLPNYSKAAQQLMVDSENIKNSFSDDSDLGKSVANEIQKAKETINNKNKYALSLPDLMLRSQNISSLARATSDQNVKRILNMLGNRLDSDISGMLIKIGKPELANQFNIAKGFWKKNVVPYYNDATIRKAALYGKTPRGVQLSRAVLHPDNEAVLQHSPEGTKNSLLFKLITGGKKTTSSGNSTMTALDIANSYQRIDPTLKQSITSFNQIADTIFEKTGPAVEARKENEKLYDQIKKLQNKKYGLKQSGEVKVSTRIPSTIPDLLKSLVNPNELKSIALHLNPIESRALADVLTSQKLRNAYINKQKIHKPIKTTMKLNDKNRLAKSIALAISSQSTHKKNNTNLYPATN